MRVSQSPACHPRGPVPEEKTHLRHALLPDPGLDVEEGGEPGGAPHRHRDHVQVANVEPVGLALAAHLLLLLVLLRRPPEPAVHLLPLLGSTLHLQLVGKVGAELGEGAKGVESLEEEELQPQGAGRVHEQRLEPGGEGRLRPVPLPPLPPGPAGKRSQRVRDHELGEPLAGEAEGPAAVQEGAQVSPGLQRPLLLLPLVLVEVLVLVPHRVLPSVLAVPAGADVEEEGVDEPADECPCPGRRAEVPGGVGEHELPLLRPGGREGRWAEHVEDAPPGGRRRGRLSKGVHEAADFAAPRRQGPRLCLLLQLPGDELVPRAVGGLAAGQHGVERPEGLDALGGGGAEAQELSDVAHHVEEHPPQVEQVQLPRPLSPAPLPPGLDGQRGGLGF